MVGVDRAPGHVLATVVKTEGPAYRRAGARALFAGSEKVLGQLSGGCLELAVAEEAARMDRHSAARLLSYDTRSGADLLWGTATGCGGCVRVLLEPWPPPDAALVETLRAALDRREPAVLATCIQEDHGLLGRHWVVTASGSVACGVEDASLRAELAGAADGVLARSGRRHRGTTVRCGGIETLVEFVPPPPQLLVIGAGDDARPLTEMAAALGWGVSLVDPRAAFVTPQRFPSVQQRIVSRPESLQDQVGFDPWTAALVMTHNFQLDAAALRMLLPLRLAYVGVLGSAPRTAALLENLGEVARDDLSFPAGLDLGAETPAEIALSILAEIQAVFADRVGGRLRDRAGPIHGAADPSYPSMLATKLSASRMAASMSRIRSATSSSISTALPSRDAMARAFRLCFKKSTWSRKATRTGSILPSARRITRISSS